MARILVTGYAGFIGSNLTRMLAREAEDGDLIVGLDALTYAAAPRWAEKGLKQFPAVSFMGTITDLRDEKDVEDVFRRVQPTHVYHLAAESHVCRSMDGPRAFAETNFMGTFNLLEAMRKHSPRARLVHVSTDEAFGDLPMDPRRKFTEKTNPKPRSPYSASKCASDLMAMAYAHSYGLDVVVTRCTNNYGANQHEEKLIPKAIMTWMKDETMTVYGDGTHVRDWIHVDNHCWALMKAMRHGRSRNTYCVGSGLELSNLQVLEQVKEVMQAMGIQGKYGYSFLPDARPTDDRRYAVSTDRIESIGWSPQRGLEAFRANLRKTVHWYMTEERK
jgi:dTDP-glucose 4,6-dehydratase